MMREKLVSFKQIVRDATALYGKERVHIVSTDGFDLTTNPKGRNSKHDRSKWADDVFKELYYGLKRSQVIKTSRRLSSGEYSFAYVKFAEDVKGNVYGIVSGKSSFHVMYPSDVWFYDVIDEDKKTVAKFMRDNNMKWYSKKILIVLNNNPQMHTEAYETEKELKKQYNLYD